jgi:hypothetical protein
MRTVVAALVILITIQPAFSQDRKGFGFETGNSLKTECDGGDVKTSDGPYLLGRCIGYVVGIADVMSADNDVNGYRACIPTDGVTEAQLRDVVTRFLNAHPETRHLLAAGLVAQALHEAFACGE